MVKIEDYRRSKARSAGGNYIWVWAVITDIWNDYLAQFQGKTVAYFFDPWEALKYGTKKYNLMCEVKAERLHKSLIDESEGT